MKKVIKKLVAFLKEMHTSTSDVSSKRVYGGVGYMACVVTIVVWEHSMVGQLLIVSAGMIGLGILDKIVQR